MSPTFLQRYQKLLDAFDRVISWVIIAAMATLTVVVVAQVFFRYVMNDSVRWGWDIPRLCFIWVIVLSIGFYGVKGGIFTIVNGGVYRVQGPLGTFIGGNNEIALAFVMTIPLMRYLHLQEQSPDL